MKTKWIKGTLLGALVVWLWLLVSWTLIPWHCSVIQKFNHETEVAEAVIRNVPYSGIYLLPSLCDREQLNLSSEDFERGPVVFASIRLYGKNFNSPVPLIASFLIQWVGALLIFLILFYVRALHYGTKVLISTLVGLAVGVIGFLPNWNWWGFPFPFVFVDLCDTTIAWFSAGLVMAYFTTPTSHERKSKIDDESEEIPLT